MVLRWAKGIDVALGMAAGNNSRSATPTGNSSAGLSKGSRVALLPRIPSLLDIQSLATSSGLYRLAH